MILIIKNKIKEWSDDGVLYFIVCILGVVALTWILKKWLGVGDEVIAGISAALITLLGVRLTNKNSQKSLDRQLAQQKETFNAQLQDQKNGFDEQMKHQNKMLEMQLMHQSNENDLARKHKFKHEQYIELVKHLSKIQNYITSQAILDFDSYRILQNLSILRDKINISKIVSNEKVIKQLNELHKDYHDFSIKLLNESKVLQDLNHELEAKENALKFIQKMNKNLMYNFFNNRDLSNSREDIKIILKEKEKNDSDLKNIKSKITHEREKILKLLELDIKEIKISLMFLIILINVELGYSNYEDHID